MCRNRIHFFFCTTEYTEYHKVLLSYQSWVMSFIVFVIQSEAKNLEDTAQPKVDAPEILPPFGRLDDML